MLTVGGKGARDTEMARVVSYVPLGRQGPLTFLGRTVCVWHEAVVDTLARTHCVNFPHNKLIYPRRTHGPSEEYKIRVHYVVAP